MYIYVHICISLSIYTYMAVSRLLSCAPRRATFRGQLQNIFCSCIPRISLDAKYAYQQQNDYIMIQSFPKDIFETRFVFTSFDAMHPERWRQGIHIHLKSWFSSSLSVRPSDRPSGRRPSVRPSVRLSNRLSVDPSVPLTVRLWVRPTVRPSANMDTCRHAYTHTCIHIYMQT